MQSLHELDENECITRAQRGDVAAFSELVRRHQDRIYRFLVRLTRSVDDARDLTQETFLRAFQHLKGWQPDARFSTWLFRIARNQAFDLLRRHQTVEFVMLEEDATAPDPAPGPDAVLDSVQRLRQLDNALLRLSIEHREIVLLREIEGLSYEELAEVLGLNLGTVKSRIARARSALLDAMPR
ncbi:MAG: sigma-70 family RNA polymerase sigma factor [Burkholderiales bacterium]|nr:sigma-70 family RNA polymerase sigma factor [Burkholderiales bacterium]